MTEQNPNRPGMNVNPETPNDPLNPNEVIGADGLVDQTGATIPDEFVTSGVDDIGINHPHGSNAPHDPAFSTDPVHDEKEYDKSVEQKPFYTKWWFWLIIIIIIVAVIYLNSSN